MYVSSSPVDISQLREIIMILVILYVLWMSDGFVFIVNINFLLLELRYYGECLIRVKITQKMDI